LGTPQQWVGTIGLVCDIIGAACLAYEIFNVNKHQQTIDTGDAGTFNGATHLTTNPAYEQHEKQKHCFMWGGMIFLLLGFVLQIISIWMANLYSN
jgi:hypothetical protein